MNQTGIRLDVITLMWLLVLAFGTLMLVRRTRLPYTVGLVIVGLIVGATHTLKAFPLTQALVFTLLLPPLLFDAAIRLPVHLLKRNWRAIAFLVLPGVVLSAFMVGYGIHYWAGLALPMALLFGALISAVDPVAVLARFRQLDVDKRLFMVVEGESLLNDGTAAVLFAALLAAMLSGKAIDPRAVTFDVVRSIAGGMVVGGAIGWSISLVMARTRDHLAEITLTTIAAYGASLLAQSIGTSGVISVISSGIVLGYYRGEAAMSATSRATIYSFWEYIAFVVNSILFLLIGIDVSIGGLARNLAPVAIAIGVVTGARAVVVYLAGLTLMRSSARLPLNWLHVLNLGGLRGALAIALAFAVPHSLPGRDVVIAMTYGVVLFTLLPQGLSIGWVLKKLNLVGREKARTEYSRLVALRQAKRAAQAELERMRAEGFIWRRMYSEYMDKIKQELEKIQSEIEEYQDKEGGMLQEQRREVEQRLLAAQQNTIRGAAETGVTSQDTARELLAEISDEYTPEPEES